MAPETRSQDVRRMDDYLEALNQMINGMEVRLDAQSDDLTQIKAMIKEIATQQIAIQQTLQTLLGEAISSQNREMKIWGSATKSSAKPRAEEAFFNQEVALSQRGLISPTNAKKNVIYVVHLDYGPNPASTRLDYISEFNVTMPILSLTRTSDVVHGKSVAQVYCVQTQAIQLVLKMAMLPKPMFWFYGRKKKIVDRSNLGEAEEFSWWFPQFNLEGQG
uniref:Uncharacterized protein n=1 Tax=Salix viminalis TaxID=40686 RepID=A0A6N2LYE1_SALVM